MLNRIVLGMTAKQFRIANGIEKGKSIRPYLSKEQIDMLEKVLVLAEENEKKTIPIRLLMCYDKVILDR